MSNTATFRFFSHVEVDDLDEVPVEDSDVLRLPAPQRLEHLEELRQQFLQCLQAGEPIDETVQHIFAVPMQHFLPASPPHYVVGYNVRCPEQIRLFSRAMRDLDRYIAILSQFALRVRVLSVADPLPEHPDGYPDLQSILRTIRYLGEGLWLKAVNDFDRQRRKTLCWRILPSTLIADGMAPAQRTDALELLLYKAQIVRILVSDPVGELPSALAEGANEYIHALQKLLQIVSTSQHRASLRKRRPLPNLLRTGRRLITS